MKRTNFAALALLLALLLALAAQYFLPQAKAAWTAVGAIYALIAVILLLWVLWRQPFSHDLAAPYRRERAGEPVVSILGDGPLPLRLGLGILTLAATVVAFLNLGNNQFTAIGFLSWLVAVGSFLALCLEVPPDWRERVRRWEKERPWRSWNRISFRVRRHHVALLAILALAAFFRFYRLDQLPGEMGSDQAEKLLDVYDVLNGQRPIFFPRNTGREMVQFYLTAGIIRLTGLEIGHLPLKLGTALTSLLTVPFVYLLGRELYGRGAALLATALFAVSHWHVAISRIGLRFPFTAAFLAPTLYFFFRAFKYNRRNDWLACGVSLGIGLHTYIPMRMVPPLLLLLVGVKTGLDWLRRRREQSTAEDAEGAEKIEVNGWRESGALHGRFWLNAVAGGVTSLLVFLPLLRYMVDDPSMFWYRVTTRALEENGQVSGEPWAIFWGNVKDALLMFNYRGDAVVSNSIPYTPFLGLVGGGLFILGIVYLLWRLLRRGDRRTVYLLLGIFVMMLPSILSLSFPGENPSRVRAGGVIPLATLVAALPLWAAGRVWRKRGRWGKVMAWTVTAAFLTVAIIDNYDYYFVRYDAHYHRSLWNTSEIGEVAAGFADSVGDLNHVYHVPYPHWVDTRLIGIYAGDITWRNALLRADRALFQQQASDPAPKLYLLHPNDQQNLTHLRQVYPDGWAIRYRWSGGGGKDFVGFYVPPGGR